MSHKWKRKVNKKMKDYGEIDYDEKTIEVNPKHGQFLNTICEEEMHKKYGFDAGHKFIKKKALKMEKHLTVAQQIKLLERYK